MYYIYKTYSKSLFFLLFLIIGQVNAQGPMISVGSDITICLPGSTTLTATVQDIREPSAYTQSATPYAPGPFNQGTSVSLSDDSQSGMINIGFPFCFFGLPYNQFIIGSNNWMGFLAGQTTTWVTVAIPNNGGLAPRGTIMGPWQDINPGLGGTIRWYVDGVAPFRRLVLAYQNVPMYSCTGQLYSSQIIIYETTNIIETHIQNKPICTTWNSGNAVHGLHHPNGLVADVIAGRNNTQWTTSNEGRRWTPSGPPAYTVSWFSLPGNTPVGTGLSVNVSPQVTTTYRAVVTYNCTNVSFDDTLVVYAASVPPPPLNGTLNVCPNGTGTYTTNVVPGATYNWVANNGNITGGQGTTSVNVQWGSLPGTITVYVGSSGCAAVDSLNVNIYPPPAMNIFGNNSPYCLNSLPVQLTATPNGGAFSGPGMSGSTFTPANALVGTHTITYTVTDNNNCLQTTTTNIVVHPLITLNTIGSDQTICAATAPVILTGANPQGGNGAYQYQWESSPDNINWISIGGGNSIDYTPGNLNANTFFRRQIISAACTSTSNVIRIQVEAIITGNTLQSSQSICDGQTPATLSGAILQGGNGQYLYAWEESTDNIAWSPASGVNNTGTYNPPALVTTHYYRRIVSAGVCPAHTSVGISIQVFSIPNVINTDDVICLGQIATISSSGNLPGGTYLWSPGNETSGTIQVSPAQTSTYTVVYTLNGCSSPTGQSVVTVNIPPPGIITPLGTTDLCPGGSVTLSGPVASSYEWTHDPTLNQQNVTVSITGTYGLTVIDANSCIATAPPVSVVVHTNPIVSAESQDVNCFGTQTGSMYASVTEGTAPFNFNWQPGGYNTASVNGVAAGYYTVTVTDNYGCTGSAGIDVIQPALLQSVANLDKNVTCPGGSDGQATANAMGGNGNYQFNWSNGQSGTILRNVPAGTYMLTVTDSKGCTDVRSVVISEPPAIVLNFTMIPVRCKGEENGSLTLIPVGGTPPYFYTWNTDPVQTTPSAVNLYKGNYSVEVMDMNGCQSSSGALITEPDSLIVIASGKEPSCFKYSDGELTASVSGGNGNTAYRWDTNPVQNTAIATGVPAGWYKVTAWDSKGCVDTSWARIGQPDPVPNPLVIGDTICINTAAYLSVAHMPDIKAHWFEQQNSSNSVHTANSFSTPKLQGTRFWFVEYEDGNGCRSIRVPVGAVVNNPPMANFEADKLKTEIPDAIVNFNITSASPKIASWHWDYGDGNTGSGTAPVHQYQNEGYYNVSLTVTDSAGCQHTITKQNLVEVKKFVNVIVPNAFSPNGDGINDFFNVQYRMIQTFEIKIFDRWGNQVYISNNVNFRWDGTSSGSPMPEGTYVYIITGTTYDGDPVELGGSFTLLR